MTIIHIVLFEFAADADAEAVNDICKRMLNLSNTCRHPENGQQYVFNGMGGKNNSPEGHDVSCSSCAAVLAATGGGPGLGVEGKKGTGDKANAGQGGLTHAFISHFVSEADRKYYLEKDPVHLAFVESVKPLVKQVRSVDFEDGVF
ncbi:hypothetical protein V502_06684 [Pseudogymnoascus sp. VKM F-4520 (FW-2644)]|nr:hypothetical protein V502_06684 [Pseudogymnoascus sp. VKM F-4520 (FW-2644)]